MPVSSPQSHQQHIGAYIERPLKPTLHVIYMLGIQALVGHAMGRRHDLLVGRSAQVFQVYLFAVCSSGSWSPWIEALVGHDRIIRINEGIISESRVTIKDYNINTQVCNISREFSCLQRDRPRWSSHGAREYHRHERPCLGHL